MIIYLVTNKINGNKYVGLTSYPLRIRKTKHKNEVKKGSQCPFHRALRNYGWKAFKWEEIDNAMFYEDLQEKEKFWIEKYDTYRNGYNATIGGEGFIGIEHVKGENHGQATITEQQALEIIELLKEGKMSMNDIAKFTNVNHSIVAHINNGKTWSHLYKGECPSKAGRKHVKKGQKGEAHSQSKITTEQAIEIKRLLSEGYNANKIANIMNVTNIIVHEIKIGRS